MICRDATSLERAVQTGGHPPAPRINVSAVPHKSTPFPHPSGGNFFFCTQAEVDKAVKCQWMLSHCTKGICHHRSCLGSIVGLSRFTSLFSSKNLSVFGPERRNTHLPTMLISESRSEWNALIKRAQKCEQVLSTLCEGWLQMMSRLYLVTSAWDIARIARKNRTLVDTNVFHRFSP